MLPGLGVTTNRIHESLAVDVDAVTVTVVVSILCALSAVSAAACTWRRSGSLADVVVVTFAAVVVVEVDELLEHAASPGSARPRRTSASRRWDSVEFMGPAQVSGEVHTPA